MHAYMHGQQLGWHGSCIHTETNEVMVADAMSCLRTQAKEA